MLNWKRYKELHQRPYAITGNEIRGYVSTLGLDQGATEEMIEDLEIQSKKMQWTSFQTARLGL